MDSPAHNKLETKVNLANKQAAEFVSKLGSAVAKTQLDDACTEADEVGRRVAQQVHSCSDCLSGPPRPWPAINVALTLSNPRPHNDTVKPSSPSPTTMTLHVEPSSMSPTTMTLS